MTLRIWKIDASFEVSFISSDQLHKICSMESCEQGNSRELNKKELTQQKENKGSQGLPRWLPREKFSPKGTNIFRKENKNFQQKEQKLSEK